MEKRTDAREDPLLRACGDAEVVERAGEETQCVEVDRAQRYAAVGEIREQFADVVGIGFDGIVAHSALKAQISAEVVDDAADVADLACHLNLIS